MAEDFLTQDEVDTLMQGMTGEVSNKSAEPDTSGAQTYDMAKQERIVRGRLPTLEIMNERFCREFRIGLFNYLKRSVEIEVGQVRITKYSEFVRALPVPTNLNIIQLKPLRGYGLLVFNPELIFLAVDNLFGSDGRFHMRVEGREFSATENRIIKRLVDLALDCYAKCWTPVFPVEFQHVRSEMNTQFANVATPNEVVISASFSLELGEQSSEFHICLPYSMLEPIRDRLASSMHSEQMEVDKRWVRLLSKQVQDASVELVANLGEATLSLGQVAQLQPGDVISVQIPDSLTVTADGVPVMECGYGISNHAYALQVKHLIFEGVSQTAYSFGERND
jgi:flagellar motor switch protein FliM